MIVPRTRLLFWVGAGLMPLAALAAAVPAAGATAAALAGAFAVLVAVDAVLARRCLGGIGVEFPRLTRLTKGRAGAVDLRIRNDSEQPRELRLGLAFPREFASPQEELVALLPERSQYSRVAWPCRPLRRGPFRLERCHLETASPMGFWSVRAVAPIAAELRVYPNLARERRNLAALFLRRGPFGVHVHRQVGQGRDFEKLRDYLPGDPLSEIHWKATAKRHRPVTKMFQIERTQEVYVIVDASRLSARLSVGAVAPTPAAVVAGREADVAAPAGMADTVLERFVTAALVVGLAADQQGDLFGLVTFGDKVQSFVRAGRGRGHYGACRDALYSLQPQMVTPDFEALYAFLRLRLRRRALLLVLTSLDDPILAESFVREVELISRSHLVMVNLLRPAGAQPLFAGAAPQSEDDLYQRLGGHLRWHSLRELERVLQRRGVRCTQLEDERLVVELVAQYLDVKRRQLL